VRSPAHSGRLLAVANNLRPEAEGQTRSLLAFKPDSDLGQVLWRLEISDDDGPVVLINDKLDDWQAFARSPAVQCLILPHVAFAAARWIATATQPEEDEEAPRAKWREYLARLGVDLSAAPEDKNSDDFDVWSFTAARQIARLQRPLDIWLKLSEDV
jgi:hypothetical protein